jgi:hypothetical protein
MLRCKKSNKPLVKVHPARTSRHGETIEIGARERARQKVPQLLLHH